MRIGALYVCMANGDVDELIAHGESVVLVRKYGGDELPMTQKLFEDWYIELTEYIGMARTEL